MQWFLKVGPGWKNSSIFRKVPAGAGGDFQIQAVCATCFLVQARTLCSISPHKVTKPAVMVRDFQTPQGSLVEQQLTQPGLAHHKENPEHAEFAVGSIGSRASRATKPNGHRVFSPFRDPKYRL